MSKETEKTGTKGLVSETAEFKKEAEKSNERSAKVAKPEVEKIASTKSNQDVVEYASSAKDLKAREYVKKKIIPEFDSLISKHKKESDISKKEVEATFKKIMNNMVADEIMTQKEMDEYLKPQKIEKTERIKTGTKKVPENRNKGIGAQLGNLFTGKKTKMIDEPVYEERKVTVDGPSQFQQDLDKAFKFNDAGKTESLNLKSKQDKLLYTMNKVCTSIGLGKIAKACRQSMTLENQEKLNKVEASMVKLTSKVTDQAKAVGKEIKKNDKKKGIIEGQLLGNQTQNIVAKRQEVKDSRSR